MARQCRGTGSLHRCSCREVEEGWFDSSMSPFDDRGSSTHDLHPIRSNAPVSEGWARVVLVVLLPLAFSAAAAEGADPRAERVSFGRGNVLAQRGRLHPGRISRRRRQDHPPGSPVGLRGLNRRWNSWLVAVPVTDSTSAVRLHEEAARPPAQRGREPPAREHPRASGAFMA